jgi:hypothetical protein
VNKGEADSDEIEQEIVESSSEIAKSKVPDLS